jgi:hypothetical protein
MYHSGANVDSEKGCSCEQEGIWELTVEPKTVVKSSLFKVQPEVDVRVDGAFMKQILISSV